MMWRYIVPRTCNGKHSLKKKENGLPNSNTLSHKVPSYLQSCKYIKPLLSGIQERGGPFYTWRPFACGTHGLFITILFPGHFNYSFTLTRLTDVLLSSNSAHCLTGWIDQVTACVLEIVQVKAELPVNLNETICFGWILMQSKENNHQKLSPGQILR